MVTGCGCTDPVVFGHQAACERELGPRYAGEAITDPTRTAGQYGQEFQPELWRTTEEIAALPPQCKCTHFRSVLTGNWRFMRRNNCPVH